MIHVFGDISTSEYEAAIELKSLILKTWPDIEQSPQHRIWIIVGAKCHGQPKRDIDILLLATFSEGLTYTPFLPFSVHGQLESPSEVHIKSFCAAIELKDHSQGKVRFEGTNVKVSYREGWKEDRKSVV